MKSPGPLGKNILWMVISRSGAQVLAILFTLLLARRLGSAGFGEYAFISAVVMLGNVLTTFGTDMLLIREIARLDNLSQLPAALLIQINLSILCILAVFFLGPALPNQSPETVSGLRIYSLALLPLAFFSVFTTALRGKQRMDSYMVLNLSVSLLQVLTVWWFIGQGASIVFLAVLLLGLQVASAVIAGILCTTRIPKFWHEWHFSFGNIQPLLRASASIALLAFIGILYQKLSVYMVSTLEGAAATGWFSAAQRAVEAAKTVHFAVFTALYPAMAQAAHSVPEQALLGGRLIWKGLFGFSLKMLIAGSGVVALVLSLFSAPVIRLLFGSEFTPSFLALRILAWILIPFTVNTFLSLSYLAARKEGTVLRIQLAGLFTLFVLNIWWIPRIGILGACLASITAETVQAAAYLLPGESLRLKAQRSFLAARRVISGGRNEFS